MNNLIVNFNKGVWETNHLEQVPNMEHQQACLRSSNLSPKYLLYPSYHTGFVDTYGILKL